MNLAVDQPILIGAASSTPKTAARAATNWSRCGTRRIPTIRLSRQRATPHAATPAGAAHPAGRTLHGSTDARWCTGSDVNGGVDSSY